MPTRIVFLGTGGGRHTTMYQTRSTGGFLLMNGNRIVHVDPGPGALTQMQKIHYDLTRTGSVIVSHCHPDHYADAESAIEGMSFGGMKKRGNLYGSPTVLEGRGNLGPCISAYHRNIISSCTVLNPGDVLEIEGMKTEICRSIHSDRTNVGFKFHTPDGIVSYVSDTDYAPEIAEQYVGSRLLILPVTAPNGSRIRGHLCTETAIEFIKTVKPETAVFVHLGILMIRLGPEKQAEKAEKATGIRTLAMHDRMVADIGSEIVFSDTETYDGEWIPDSSP
ncbi:MAG: MBL fold metallo-hydrolase [Candidatus Methanomethylophilaceae archaeon]|jgi:phosphoribosyl 1,2-cyclic phosphodiesterase